MTCLSIRWQSAVSTASLSISSVITCIAICGRNSPSCGLVLSSPSLPPCRRALNLHCMHFQSQSLTGAWLAFGRRRRPVGDATATPLPGPHCAVPRQDPRLPRRRHRRRCWPRRPTALRRGVRRRRAEPRRRPRRPRGAPGPRRRRRRPQQVPTYRTCRKPVSRSGRHVVALLSLSHCCALHMVCSVEYVQLFLAVTYAGAIIAPLNYRWVRTCTLYFSSFIVFDSAECKGFVSLVNCDPELGGGGAGGGARAAVGVRLRRRVQLLGASTDGERQVSIHWPLPPSGRSLQDRPCCCRL